MSDDPLTRPRSIVKEDDGAWRKTRKQVFGGAADERVDSPRGAINDQQIDAGRNIL